MTLRSIRLSWAVAAALVTAGGIGCSPAAPSAPTVVAAPVSNDLVMHAITPVAGKPAEHTFVRILGRGFQPGATVSFDGTAAPVTVESGQVIFATAPPHSAGAIDIVVTNPDGRSSRLENRFAYVEELVGSGDITVRPGESVTATLGREDPNCTGEGVPCRRLILAAPADATVEVELVLLDRAQQVGLFDKGQISTFHAPTHYPKQLTVRNDQEVWVMGEWSLFSVRARLAK